MIVIVSGLPGSGKTFFATRLAERLGATYIGSDKARKKLSAQGKYSLDQKMAVYLEMASATKKAVMEKQNVVVDGTFYLNSMRRLFTDLARECRSSVYWIRITADEQLIKRRTSGPRDDSEADFKIYELIRGQYQPMHIPHLILDSGENDITSMLNTAIEYITNIHDQKSN